MGDFRRKVGGLGEKSIIFYFFGGYFDKKRRGVLLFG